MAHGALPAYWKITWQFVNTNSVRNGSDPQNTFVSL
jgi:hypothetical protein